jgi:hypothetical protein
MLGDTLHVGLLARTCCVTGSRQGRHQEFQRGIDCNLRLPLKNHEASGSAGLFVGVNEFTVDKGISRLNYAVHDAVETAHLFVFELKLIPAKNCYVLLSGEPDSKATSVQQHLERLRKNGATITNAQKSTILSTFLTARKVGRGPSDMLVCSFSSHGFNQGPSAFVMPSDGLRELLDACQERIPARVRQALVAFDHPGGVRRRLILARLHSATSCPILGPFPVHRPNHSARNNPRWPSFSVLATGSILAASEVCAVSRRIIPRG